MRAAAVQRECDEDDDQHRSQAQVHRASVDATRRRHGDREIRRENERNRPHEQSDQQCGPAGDLEHAHRIRRGVGERDSVALERGRLGCVVPELARPEAEEHESGGDAQNARCRMSRAGIARPCE